MDNLPHYLRMLPRYLRALGLLVLFAGGCLVYFGANPITFNYRGVTIGLPLEFPVLAAGLLLFLVPVFFLYTLALFLPSRAKERVLDIASVVEPDIRMLQGTSDPERVSSVIVKHFRLVYQRLFLILFVLLLFGFAVPPVFLHRMVSDLNYDQASNRLMNLVHQIRFQYSSGDRVREQIRDAKTAMDAVTPESTYSRRIYDILGKLYAVENKQAFEDEVRAVYKDQIVPHRDEETGLLRIEDFDLPKLSAESGIGRITFLTLLAMVCNHLGDNGRNWHHYLQAFQLLQRAEQVGIAPVPIPAFHNHRGISFAGLFKAYDDYAKQFQGDSGVTAKSKRELGREVPISRVQLLMYAEQEYRKSDDPTSPNMVRALTMNNRVDAKLAGLRWIHLESHPIENEKGEGDSDASSFLAEKLAVPSSDPASTAWRKGLVKILSELKEELRRAIELSPEREFFVTRAQLYSLSGNLKAKYQLTDGFVSNSDEIAELALRDLTTAFSLKSDKRLLQESEKKLNWLEWLWEQPTVKPRLQALAESAE